MIFNLFNTELFGMHFSLKIIDMWRHFSDIKFKIVAQLKSSRIQVAGSNPIIVPRFLFL